ncbi:germination protein YpeB [Brevibacillus fulvus]|uniref:Spore germination protein n=1 Tax=Brevibacillus fulvus TaxID=1125967 RepID=A0A938XV61_9BACL|nr:germination protein YpeB [Brevibacillus fulvus]MBM7588684.1 spore germination protein [Brevibacillus fulvus]
MIYGHTARVLFPVAVVALIGAGMWGYQEHNEKNSILIKAENQYQRAFHDLNYNLNKLHDELGKALVVNSRKQEAPCLTNVWRLAYAAQSDVGQLPLTLVPFNNTEEFLSKVADFSYGVAIRDLDKQPLSEKEYSTLQNLYNHSKKIREQLVKVQSNVIDKRLRWMDVETAIAGDDKKSDNTIVDGFRSVDKTVQEFPEVDWGPGIQNKDRKEQIRIKGLDGKPVGPEQAKQKALEFVGMDERLANVQVVDNGKDGQNNAYSVRITSNQLRSPINLDITKKGGHVVWLLNERDIGQQKLNMSQAEQRATQFLQSHGYGAMVATERDSYGGLAVFTFVPEVKGVRIYPDAVTVKVALDTGDVNGFHSTQYLFNHKQREIPQPKLNSKQARAKLNPHIKVTSQNLALIEGKNDGKEVLCYEFASQFDGNTYMIYINAENGDEEEIVKMDSR